MRGLLNRTSISAKLIITSVLLLVIVVAVNYVVFLRGYRRDVQSELVGKAAAFTAVADAAKSHASKQMLDRSFDVQNLVEEARAVKERGGDITATRFFNAIPVVVGWTTAGEAAKKEGLEFRVAAYDARNKKNEPEPGSFRAELLRDLERQVKAGGEESLSRVNGATNSLHYMRAIRLDDSCMMCHGEPSRSKTGDGRDVLGYVMEGWKPGDMHGAFEVVLPLNGVDAQVAGFFRSGLAVSVPILLGAALVFVLVMRVLLVRPVAALVGVLRDVAQGDLTRRMEIDRKDEIGELVTWFDKGMGNVREIISEVAGTAHEVAGAATEIAASSEEMSAAIGEVARQAAQASEASVESGRIASEGQQVVGETVAGMKQIDGAVSASASSVSDLGERSKQIGQVVAVINDIADQTNLLALNAAIEAARAGEHGRGFAVVADEVRKLAERTTKATEEIAGSIRAIQKETAEAVSRMERGTDQVKTGVQRAEVAGESLGKIVTGAQAVAEMVRSISAASEEAGAGAGQAADAAAQLSTKAEQLQALVSRFRV